MKINMKVLLYLATFFVTGVIVGKALPDHEKASNTQPQDSTVIISRYGASYSFPTETEEDKEKLMAYLDAVSSMLDGTDKASMDDYLYNSGYTDDKFNKSFLNIFNMED